LAIADAHKKDADYLGQTHVVRIPQGAENAHFMSFFDGFADGPHLDAGMDKFIDTSTTGKQDISKVAQEQKKAAELILNDLGHDYTKDVYYIKDNKLVTSK